MCGRHIIGILKSQCRIVVNPQQAQGGSAIRPRVWVGVLLVFLIFVGRRRSSLMNLLGHLRFEQKLAHFLYRQYLKGKNKKKQVCKP